MIRNENKLNQEIIIYDIAYKALSSVIAMKVLYETANDGRAKRRHHTENETRSGNKGNALPRQSDGHSVC